MADYYKILNVEKDATQGELESAYQKLAKRWHFDLNIFNMEKAKININKIQTAYNFLSDSEKRDKYDNGEIHDDLPFLDDELPHPVSLYLSYPENPKERFYELFGNSEFLTLKSIEIEKTVLFDLEDFYRGTIVNLEISRWRDSDGCFSLVSESLTVVLEIGAQRGTRLTFPGLGNEECGAERGDVVIILDQKPHKVFTRAGDYLIVTQTISLREAVKGYTFSIRTLDGRSLSIAINKFKTRNYVIPNEGMPLLKDPTRFGNLIIKFDIKFPTRLREWKGE